MAQLVWRPIEAPQGSIRDIALAGSNITNSFDRMGQMLRDREAALRQQATGDATAQALMAGTPEEIAALRARGLDGLDKRVDKAAFARSLGQAETDLLARTKTREEVANIQAAAQLGDEGATYLALLGQGKRDEAMKFAGQMAAQNPDMWGRVAYGFGKDGEGVFADWSTRDETAKNNQRVDARARQQIAASNAANSLARDKWNFERSRLLEAEGREKGAIAFADTFTRAMPARFSTADSIAALRQSAGFQRQDPRAQSMILARLRDQDFGRDAYFTPTTDALARQSIVPLAPGEPGSMVGNAVGVSANGLTERLNTIRDQTQRARDMVANRFDANNMASSIIAGAAKYKDTTPDEVYAAAEKRGISKSVVESMRESSGGQMGYPEIMATLEMDGNVRDADFWSRRNLSFRALKNGALASDEYLMGGERALDQRTREITDLKRNQGDLARVTNERANQLRNPEQILAEIEQLDAQIRRSTAGGQLGKAERTKVLRLEARLNALMRTLNPPQE